MIGVSEISHSVSNPLSSNVDIPGYTFFKTQSQTQNGDIGLYPKNFFTSNPRIDLDSCTDYFETIWVEIENRNDKNFLICCVYRNPISNVDNKLVFIIGDFNVNVQDYACHTPTTDLVNNFFSLSLLPSYSS